MKIINIRRDSKNIKAIDNHNILEGAILVTIMFADITQPSMCLQSIVKFSVKLNFVEKIISLNSFKLIA